MDRTFHLRRPVAAVAVAAVLLGVGGCGGDSDSDSGKTDTKKEAKPAVVQPVDKTLSTCLKGSGLNPQANGQFISTGGFVVKGIAVEFPSGTTAVLFPMNSARDAKYGRHAQEVNAPKGAVVTQTGNVVIKYSGSPTAAEKDQIDKCASG